MPSFSDRGRNRRGDRTPTSRPGATASRADLLRLAATPSEQPGSPSGKVFGPRRRDRRGRGMRGPLLPPDAPAHRTRAQRFDDLVLDVVEELDRRWAELLFGTEFAVEDVPPSDPAPWEDGGVPLGRFFPPEAGQPGRVVVYRRPVEARAVDLEDLADLVRDVVVEQVAQLLARAPEEIDPHFGDRF